MKRVIDIYGEEFIVDDLNKKLYSYNNAKREIFYSAEIITDGITTGVSAYYIEQGTVTDIREKLKIWNNRLLLIYASFVGFNAAENDPGGRIYNRMVEYVSANENKFFTKKGDFRKKYLISNDDIKKLLKMWAND